MDILSHALYTNLVLKKLPATQRGLAIVFSLLPDFISFAFMNYKDFFRKTMHYSEPPLSAFPKRVFVLYNMTHSLVVWLSIFIVLGIFGWWYLALAWGGWALHILLDIFTHNKDFLPTPVFWPLSSFYFSGLAWSNMWFMLANYAVIVVLYFMFYF